MIRLAATLLLAATALAALGDEQVESRRNALSLAGAWANDGFKLRDGHWTGVIEAAGTKLIRVNLFAGNHYWFTLAGSGTAKKVAVAIYDESGNPVQFEHYVDGARAAAGFSPKTSGPYLIRMQSLAGPRGEFTLVYSYR